jgi:hypothetical protein
LVFLDEAGANIAMGRSHAWVQRGEEFVEARPMNWGNNLTMVGAIRRTGWVTLSTKWRAMTKVRFIEWVRRRLAPRLRPGDIVLLDNLQAHTDPAVREAIEQRGARVRGTCRPIRMISIPSNRCGASSSNGSAPTLHAPRARCAAWPAPHGTW